MIMLNIWYIAYRDTAAASRSVYCGVQNQLLRSVSSWAVVMCTEYMGIDLIGYRHQVPVGGRFAFLPSVVPLPPRSQMSYFNIFCT